MEDIARRPENLNFYLITYRICVLIAALVFLAPRDGLIRLGRVSQRILDFVLIDPITQVIYIITQDDALINRLRNYRRHVTIALSFIAALTLVISFITGKTNFSALRPQYLKLNKYSFTKPMDKEEIIKLLREAAAYDKSNWEKLFEEQNNLWKKVVSNENDLRSRVLQLESKLAIVLDKLDGNDFKSDLDKDNLRSIVLQLEKELAILLEKLHGDDIIAELEGDDLKVRVLKLESDLAKVMDRLDEDDLKSRVLKLESELVATSSKFDGYDLENRVLQLESELITAMSRYGGDDLKTRVRELESELVKVLVQLHGNQNEIDQIQETLQKITDVLKTKFDQNSIKEIFSDMNISLITPKVVSLIQAALTKYHQDVLDEADYALQTRGAYIIHSMTSKTYYHVYDWAQYFLRARSIFQITGLLLTNNAPYLAIAPQGQPGIYWSIAGNNGTIAIRLSESIQINGITIEYPSSNILPNTMINAPRSIELFGISNYPKRPREIVSLGCVEYDINMNSPIQTFNITKSDVYKAVQVKIHSNWGNLNYTDIYRIRIHGEAMQTKLV